MQLCECRRRRRHGGSVVVRHRIYLRHDRLCIAWLRASDSVEPLDQLIQQTVCVAYRIVVGIDQLGAVCRGRIGGLIREKNTSLRLYLSL